MGVEATNYVIEDEIIDRLLKEEFDFEEFAQNLNFIYAGYVKSWSPMYELLIRLDKSEQEILKELSSDDRLLEDTVINPRIKYFYSSQVNSVWQELKNISIGNLEESIDNPIIAEEIVDTEGYWNDRIENKEHITREFFELYKTFYQANLLGHGVIITYG